MGFPRVAWVDLAADANTPPTSSQERKLRLTKRTLLATLPLREGQLTIRQWTREDLDLLAAWPDYAFPYHGMEFSFRAKSLHEKDTDNQPH